MEPGHTVEQEPARSRADRQFIAAATTGLGSEHRPLTDVDHALHRLRALRHVQQVPESFEVDAPCVVRDGVRQHHTVVHLRRHREEVV